MGQSLSGEIAVKGAGPGSIHPDRMTTAPRSVAQSEIAAWHTLSAAEVLAQLRATPDGLSAQEASRRLAAGGANELVHGTAVSPRKIFVRQFKSLIIWLLIGAGVISGALGEKVDAFAILAIVVLNAAIGFYQEFKAETSLAALRGMTAPLAKVRRDGRVGGGGKAMLGKKGGAVNEAP